MLTDFHFLKLSHRIENKSLKNEVQGSGKVCWVPTLKEVSEYVSTSTLLYSANEQLNSYLNLYLVRYRSIQFSNKLKV